MFTWMFININVYDDGVELADNKGREKVEPLVVGEAVEDCGEAASK